MDGLIIAEEGNNCSKWDVPLPNEGFVVVAGVGVPLIVLKGSLDFTKEIQQLWSRFQSTPLLRNR